MAAVQQELAVINPATRKGENSIEGHSVMDLLPFDQILAMHRLMF